MPMSMDVHNSISYGAKSNWIVNKKIEDAINWLGEDCTSAVQKGITGATGLLTQPFIDLNNKDVDEKTRKTSCAKTISRLIVGTATGVVIRDLCIRGISAFTKTKAVVEDELKHAAKKSGKKLQDIGKNIEIKPWQQWLLPESMKNSKKVAEIKIYRGSIGTFAALGIMLFTNFLIDAPWTSWCTNNIVLPWLNKEKLTKEVNSNEISK